jgi:hypothetical protein
MMADLIFYAFAIVVMWVSFHVLKRNRRQQAARQAPERLAEAATRGWAYEHDQTPLFENERWRGSADGIAWVIEAARSGTRRSGQFGTGAALKGSATLITRWHTEQRMPVAGAVLLMHHAEDQTDEISEAIGEITSPLARKLIGKVLDVGLSMRFGSAIGADVEGTTLVPGTLPASGYEGYSLLATDPSEASALLFQRLGPALSAARAAAGPISLSVLITPEGLAVSAPTWPAKTDELVPIVNAGLVLTKALR